MTDAEKAPSPEPATPETQERRGTGRGILIGAIAASLVGGLALGGAGGFALAHVGHRPGPVAEQGVHQGGQQGNGMPGQLPQAPPPGGGQHGVPPNQSN